MTRRFPQGPHFSAGGGSTRMYRGVTPWEAAATEAGSFDQAAVIARLTVCGSPSPRLARSRWCPASTSGFPL
jgi:hypothetical protein